MLIRVRQPAEITTAQAGHGLPSTKQQCLDYAAGIGLATNAVDIEATCEPDATAPHGCAPMGCYLSIPVSGGMSVTWNGDAARTQNDNGIRACARRRACVRFPSPGAFFLFFRRGQGRDETCGLGVLWCCFKAPPHRFPVIG